MRQRIERSPDLYTSELHVCVWYGHLDPPIRLIVTKLRLKGEISMVYTGQMNTSINYWYWIYGEHDIGYFHEFVSYQLCHATLYLNSIERFH